ncbi:hypothetical protein [Lysobacter sp. CA199]|uniref:hypothetical protein n=1 Tax=Lysobacter sp. CA199 TaxID=3455608 RepID=UPI003F8D73C4
MLATAAAIRCTVAAWPVAAAGRPSHGAAPIRSIDERPVFDRDEAALSVPPPRPAAQADEPH